MFFSADAQAAQVGKLRNPVNDALAVGAMLHSLGFATTIAVDLNRRRMKQAVDDFAKLVTDRSLVAFFFAGHGSEV